MRIGFTADQERLRKRLRDYFAQLMTDELRAELTGGGDYGDGEAYKRVVRQLGADGWLALGWPREHGGSGGTYKLPVMVKDPDEDVMVPTQLDWIRNYLNTVQSWIVNRNAAWHSCVDMDSFIDWMFVQEVVGNYEPFHPKSCYMYKDRSGKLTMGPLWDFDYGTFKTDYRMTPVYHYAIWYGYMLKDATFVARVKERWPAARAAFKQVLDYIDRQAALNKASAEKDWVRWASGLTVNGDESLSYDQAVKTLRNNLEARINQMGTEVANMGL